MTARIRNSFSSNIALAIAATLWASSASALDLKLPNVKLPEISGNYYGGAGFGGSQIKPRVNASGYTVSDSSDSGVQLFLGRDISKRLSVEAYYSNMGTAALDNGVVSGGIDYSAFGASGLLYLIGGGGADAIASRRGFNVYARAGYGKLNNKGSGIPFNRVNNWHWSTGVGAEYVMENGFGLRTEFNNFDSDARVVSFSIVKRFSYRGSAGIPLIPEPVVDADSAMADTKLSYRDDIDEDGVANEDDRCDATAAGVLVDKDGCTFSGVLEGVSFASGSADLTPTGKEALNNVIAALKKNPEVQISVQAHTDSRGPAEGNMELSRKRAGSVVRYLLDVGEVDLARMTAIGYGESRPRKSNRTAEGRMANRRVEVKTVK